MISPEEIKSKAQGKYKCYLQSILQKTNLFPLKIIGDKSPGESLYDVQKEILALVNYSKEKKGYGYSVKYKTVKTKKHETQSLPQTIFFETEHDFIKFLNKEKEVSSFISDCKLISDAHPELQPWIIENPLTVVKYRSEWEKILPVCTYFKNNPWPNLYLRELPVKVNTKFIEGHSSIIGKLLDVIIEPYVNKSEKDFEKRFNLKNSEALIRFRILDKKICNTYFSGIDDISIPISQFQNLTLPISKAIILENKTTYSTFFTLPQKEDTIAIFGSGNAVLALRDTEWLKNIEIFYWGDLDAQGFEILSRVRGCLPQTKSIFMDQDTFEKFFENDTGTPSKCAMELNLTSEEMTLYNKIKVNNWRLEQEKIPFDYVRSLWEHSQ